MARWNNRWNDIPEEKLVFYASLLGVTFTRRPRVEKDSGWKLITAEGRKYETSFNVGQVCLYFFQEEHSEVLDMLLKDT